MSLTLTDLALILNLTLIQTFKFGWDYQWHNYGGTGGHDSGVTTGGGGLGAIPHIGLPFDF